MSIEGEVLVPDATTIETDHADDAQDSLNNIKRSNNEELSITDQLSSSLNTLSFKEKTPPKDYPSREERYAAQVEADSRSIFVGNIASEVTPETIEDHFKNCGTIKRITLLYDKKTGAPKGYSYVEFDSIEAQNNALEYNGSELLGTTITVYKKRTNLPGFSRRFRYQKPNVYYQQHWSDPYNYLVENTGYPQTSLGFDRSNGLQNSNGGHRGKGAYRRHRRKGQQYQSNSFLDSSNSDNKGSSLGTNIIDQSDTRSQR